MALRNTMETMFMWLGVYYIQQYLYPSGLMDLRSVKATWARGSLHCDAIYYVDHLRRHGENVTFWSYIWHTQSLLLAVPGVKKCSLCVGSAVKKTYTTICSCATMWHRHDILWQVSTLIVAVYWYVQKKISCLTHVISLLSSIFEYLPQHWTLFIHNDSRLAIRRF